MNRTTRLIFLGLSLLIHPTAAMAQYFGPYEAPKVGIIAGSHGIGLEGSFPLASQLSGRAGFNYFPLPALSIGYQGNPVELNRSNVNAFVDWSPFLDRTSFISRKGYFSIGFSYYLENSMVRSYLEDDEVYTFQFARATPYIGIGLKNVHISQALSLGFNFGCFIPIKETEVTLVGGPNDYRYHLLENQWNSFQNKFMAGMNANIGLHYHL